MVGRALHNPLTYRNGCNGYLPSLVWHKVGMTIFDRETTFKWSVAQTWISEGYEVRECEELSGKVKKIYN